MKRTVITFALLLSLAFTVVAQVPPTPPGPGNFPNSIYSGGSNITVDDAPIVNGNALNTCNKMTILISMGFWDNPDSYNVYAVQTIPEDFLGYIKPKIYWESDGSDASSYFETPYFVNVANYPMGHYSGSTDYPHSYTGKLWVTKLKTNSGIANDPQYGSGFVLIGYEANVLKLGDFPNIYSRVFDEGGYYSAGFGRLESTNTTSGVQVMRGTCVIATNDNFTSTQQGNTASVFNNDHWGYTDGLATIPNISLAWSTANPSVTGITPNADGTFTIASNAPSGTYSYEYTICDQKINISPSECKTAIATLNVSNPLPVNFGSISAFLKNGALQVNWQTLTEKNNDHFIIEVSKDGKIFSRAGTVQSKAVNGNSSVGTSYTFNKTVSTGAAVLGVIALMGMGAMGINRRRKAALVMAIGAIIFFGYSCQKNDGKLDDANGQSLFVRVVQVDKDGTATYSKVIKAIEE